LAEGKASLFSTIIKAHFAFWGALGDVLKKRNAVKKLGETKTELYSHSVVWQYFAKGKKKFSDLPGMK